MGARVCVCACVSESLTMMRLLALPTRERASQSEPKWCADSHYLTLSDANVVTDLLV